MTPDFVLPSNLATAIDEDDNDDDLVRLGFAAIGRRAWLRSLPDLVADLADRWSLRVEPPFQPGGVTAWVARAHDARGRPVVLKVGWRHAESEHEADALRVWDGNGAVRLLDSVRLEHTAALLLEDCAPGEPLSARPSAVQDAVLPDLFRRLWIEPPAGHPFRSLIGMCTLWADEFDDKYARFDLDLEPDIVAAGIGLLRELPTTADRNALLCTDLHAGNVLSAHREPWLAIDPKPYVGDPAYDPVQYMLDAAGRLVADPQAFVADVAERCGVNPDRLRRWVFARSVQEAFDSPELIGVARALAGSY